MLSRSHPKTKWTKNNVNETKSHAAYLNKQPMTSFWAANHTLPYTHWSNLAPACKYASGTIRVRQKQRHGEKGRSNYQQTSEMHQKGIDIWVFDFRCQVNRKGHGEAQLIGSKIFIHYLWNISLLFFLKKFRQKMMLNEWERQEWCWMNGKGKHDVTPVGKSQVSRGSRLSSVLTYSQSWPALGSNQEATSISASVVPNHGIDR